MKKVVGILLVLFCVFLGGCSSSTKDKTGNESKTNTLAPYYNDANEEAILLSKNVEALNENQTSLFYEIARGAVEANSDEDISNFEDYSLRVEKIKGKGKYKINYILQDVYDDSLYESSMIVELEDEDLASDKSFKIYDFSFEYDEQLEVLTNESSSTSYSSEEKKIDDDITVLTDNPSSDLTWILDELARTKFEEEFPYKGSKIHTVMGKLQDWTPSGEQWYYKAEATIVNESGAKRDANVEIYITPTDPQNGTVEIIAY